MAGDPAFQFLEEDGAVISEPVQEPLVSIVQQTLDGCQKAIEQSIRRNVDVSVLRQREHAFCRVFKKI